MKQSRQSSDSEDPVADSIDRLCDELSVVRQVLDDVYSELQSANRNRDNARWRPAPVHVTSMPRDSAGPNG